MRRVTRDPQSDNDNNGWLAAGTEGDGSMFMREMTMQELKEQEVEMDEMDKRQQQQH